MVDIDKVINMEVFLEEVGKRRCLWDMGDDGHKDKIKKKKAWNEVCNILFLEFDNLPEEVRECIGQKLMSKWRNVKDYYLKCLKKDFRGKNGKIKYAYANQLSFLSKVDHDFETATAASSVKVKNFKTEVVECESPTESAGESQSAGDSTWSFKVIQRKEEKKKIEQPVVFKRRKTTAEKSKSNEPEFRPLQFLGTAYRELPNSSTEHSPAVSLEYCPNPVIEYAPSPNFSSASAPDDPDKEDRAFFESLLPSLRTLDTDEKLEFRMEVMQLLQKFRKSHLSKKQ